MAGLDEHALDHLSASMAKWRYATIVHSMGELFPHRNLCENVIQPEHFPNVQDKAQLNRVMTAAKHKDLWQFMATAHGNVLKDFEGCRHWGMVCTCLKHQEERQKAFPNSISIECFWNGRRLKDAWGFVSDEIEATKVTGRNMNNTLTEGSDVMYEMTVVMWAKKSLTCSSDSATSTNCRGLLLRQTPLQGPNTS